MAVIGSAEVIVRAITTGFEDTIRNDLRRISGTVTGRRAGESLGQSLIEGFARSTSGNIFGNLMDGLKNIQPEAEAARRRFQSLVRVGYVLQGALGLIVGAISPVIVSLGTLIGILGKALPAVAVLASAFVTLRVAMSTAKFGFGDIMSAVKAATAPNKALGKSLAEVREEFQQLQFAAEAASLSEERAALNLEKAKEALMRAQDLPVNSRERRDIELAFREADLAYRQAKDRASDLNKEVAKGPEALAKASGSDPFAGLNAAQREFAEYLVSLQPKIDALELSVSRALLPPIKEAVQLLEREFLPILNQRLPEIAKQVGEGLKSIVDGLDFEQINRILLQMTTPFEEGGRSNLQLFSELLGNILNIFLEITEATGPLLSDLLTFLADKTGDWLDNLRSMDLEGFFAEAGAYAADLFEIIGNVFGGISNLIGLTTGPGSAGEDMIQWMKDATLEFKNMFSEDPEAGKQFFKDAFANARSVLGAIGAFLDEILKIADNPSIKEAFDALAKSAPAFGDMLQEMINGLPSFAEFLGTLIETAALLTDSDQIASFFDTLNFGAEKLNDFLRSGFGQAVLDNLGPIFAFFSAVGLIFDLIEFAFKVIVGYLLLIYAPFKLISKGFATLKSTPGGIAKAFKAAGVIGLIVTLVSYFIEFFEKSAEFRGMIERTFSGIGEAFQGLVDSFGGLFDNIFGNEGLGGALKELEPVIRAVFDVVIPLIGGIIEFLLGAISTIVDVIASIFGSIFDVIKPIIGGIIALFKGDLLGGLTSIALGVINIIVGVVQGIGNVIIGFINLVIDFINGFIAVLRNSPIGQKIEETGFKLTNIGKIGMIDMTGAVSRGASDFINRNEAGNAVRSTFTGSSDRALVNRTQNARDVSSSRSPAQSSPNINITVNPSAKMNEKELSDVISRRIALEVKKGKI
jgi:hypothetical protein